MRRTCFALFYAITQSDSKIGNNSNNSLKVGTNSPYTETSSSVCPARSGWPFRRWSRWRREFWSFHPLRFHRPGTSPAPAQSPPAGSRSTRWTTARCTGTRGPPSAAGCHLRMTFSSDVCVCVCVPCGLRTNPVLSTGGWFPKVTVISRRDGTNRTVIDTTLHSADNWLEDGCCVVDAFEQIQVGFNTNSSPSSGGAAADHSDHCDWTTHTLSLSTPVCSVLIWPSYFAKLSANFVLNRAVQSARRDSTEPCININTDDSLVPISNHTRRSHTPTHLVYCGFVMILRVSCVSFACVFFFWNYSTGLDLLDGLSQAYAMHRTHDGALVLRLFALSSPSELYA